MSEHGGYREPDGAGCYDPFAAYGNARRSSPNMLVLGRVGSGEAWFVVAAIRRGAVVVDHRGKYGPLVGDPARGAVALPPGGGGRVNPLARQMPRTQARPAPPGDRSDEGGGEQ